MPLRHLAAVVADVTPWHPASCQFSEAVACWETLHPSTGISAFVHMCHVVDTLWCIGALSDLPDVWKGTKSGVDKWKRSKRSSGIISIMDLE